MKQKTYTVLDYDEIDMLVQKHFHRPDYESISGQEWNNNSSYTFRIDGQMSVYDSQNVETFKAKQNNGEWHLRAFMNQMCADGVLQPGDYLITVSW